MKIGVALSGCDVGGICAWKILKALEEYGFEIGMVSACGVPAAAALLYAGGLNEKKMLSLSKTFLKDASELDLDFAIANFSAAFRPKPGKKIPVAINAVNAANGNVVTFTDMYSLKKGNIKTYKIKNTYDVLSATFGFICGLDSYSYKGLRLCDYGSCYGSPVQPLKLAGFTRIISLAFVPKIPKTFYETLVKRVVSSKASNLGIHVATEFGENTASFEEYSEIAESMLDKNYNKIVLNTVF